MLELVNSKTWAISLMTHEKKKREFGHRQEKSDYKGTEAGGRKGNSYPLAVCRW